MQTFTTDQVRYYLPFHRLIDGLRAMFIEGCVVPPRHVHTVGEGTVLIMPAWRVNGKFGVKTITIYPENAKQGLPGLHASYVLFNALNGVPLCVMDGIELTSRRTAAASALAASYLAKPEASKYLIVGSGRVASLMAEAMSAIRPIVNVKVWNEIDRKGGKALVDLLREKGFDAELVPDLKSAVEAADIITCATLSTSPLVKGEWLRPGTHLDLIGSFTPAMCETDVECFKRASVFTDTGALVKSGDVLNAIAKGTFVPTRDHRGTLESMCRGKSSRRSLTEITLFKSVGTALEDLAAAEMVYDRAVKQSKI